MNTVRHHLFLLIICMCLSSAFAEPADSPVALSTGKHTIDIQVDQRARQYIVYVPTRYNSKMPTPVVILCHGGGGKASPALFDYGWATKANRETFIVIAPEGTPPKADRTGRFIGNPQTWNDGSKRQRLAAVAQNVDDVKFFAAIVDDLPRRLNIDSRRIYITGFSNGASMAFRVARELPHRVAAAAPVAGSDWLSEVKPKRAVPLMYITGDADPLNPINGGEIFIGRASFGTKPKVADMIDRWGKLHQAAANDVVAPRNTTRREYRNEFGELRVVLITLTDHGHHWPGGKGRLGNTQVTGKNSSRFIATDEIWRFFKRQQLPRHVQPSAADTPDATSANRPAQPVS